MPPTALSFSLGKNTAIDELRLPPGWLKRILGWYYRPDDPDRPHKYPGRSLAAALPGAATAANTKGIAHLQYDNGDDQIIVAANSKLYQADAGLTLGAWTTAADAFAADFARTGAYLKVIGVGNNSYVLWTGAVSERPLVRDEDGHWRYLSMKPPLAPTAGSALASIGVDYRPQDSEVDAGVTSIFSVPGAAIDADKATHAKAVIGNSIQPPTSSAGYIWKYTGDPTGGLHVNPLGFRIFIDWGSFTASDLYGVLAPGSQTVPAVAHTEIAISEDGGATYTATQTVSNAVPFSRNVTSFLVTTATVWTDIRIRVRLIYTSGAAIVIASVYDIWAGETGASATGITPGDYYYAVTEVYRRQLASGVIDEVEGPPSERLLITVPAGKFGTTFTFPTQQNTTADGLPAGFMFRRVYRTTSTGLFPDLGFIAEVPITQATFVDPFTVSGITLGAPGLKVVSLGGVFAPQAGQAPAFYDATIHKGAILAIPQGQRKHLQYALPGLPDSWPLPFQDISTLPLERNEDGCGVVSVNENILLFLRTRVMRIRDLPMISQPGFDLGNLRIDILSPSEGLATGPLGYCLFNTENGSAVVAWVSDNGVWMTDGSLPAERGLGAVKLTAHLNWDQEVDVASLSSATLTYDPILQVVFLDCVGPDGDQKSLLLHVATQHWVPLGEKITVPKATNGPVNMQAHNRTIGETASAVRHWSLNKDDMKVYNEHTGEDAAGEDITSFLDTGWHYPAGELLEWMLWGTSLYHSDWGQSALVEMELSTRRDAVGIEQHVSKNPSLRGARLTSNYVGRSGQALRAQIRHVGKTSSNGSSLKAIGPLMLDLALSGEVEEIG